MSSLTKQMLGISQLSYGRNKPSFGNDNADNDNGPDGDPLGPVGIALRAA